MIVPSFSSKGFKDVKSQYEQIEEQLVDYSLISAYDLRYNLVPNDFYSSDFVFIDSGGYEMRKLAEIYYGIDISAKWNLDMYIEVLNTVQSSDSNIIIVNYDPLENEVLDKQMEHASVYGKIEVHRMAA